MNLKEGTVEEAVQRIEREMKAMWDTGEAIYVMEKDVAFIKTIMLALHYEREYFTEQVGVTIGEA